MFVRLPLVLTSHVLYFGMDPGILEFQHYFRGLQYLPAHAGALTLLELDVNDLPCSSCDPGNRIVPDRELVFVITC